MDWEFYLADRLQCTVAEYRVRVSQAEFRQQITWHSRRLQGNSMREV